MLGPADVPAVAAGSALFAAGAHTPGRAPVLAALAAHGPVRLTSVAEVPGDALVTAVTTPCAAAAVWPDDAAWRAAVRVVEERAGRRVAAVVPLAARDVLAAAHAAAALGVPCADASAGGRGAGRLDLTALALDGHAADPVVAGRGGADIVAVRAGSAAAQRIATTVAEDMGGAAVAAYQARPADFVAGAVRECLLAGRALQRGTLPAAPLFTGTVVDVAGTARGTATISGPGGDRVLRVDYDGTYLVVTEDGEVRAATPDLICVVDSGRGEPVPAGGFALGGRVDVLVVPAAPRWLLQDGLSAAGPRRFGYDVDHSRTTGTTGTTHGVVVEIGT